MNDFELGWRFNKDAIRINNNLYYMHYKDQLVLTGAVDDVGAPIRATSGKSYRFGLEMDAYIPISSKFTWQPNLAVSSNKNVDFYAPINGTLTDLGKTDLAFSPELIAGNVLIYSPNDNFQLSILSKYIGKQVMGNLNSSVSTLDVLDSYFVTDLNASYVIRPKSVLKSITLTALVNNLFDLEYVSNGYYYTYDDTWSVPGVSTTIDGAGFYPQATRNFLIGVNLMF